ncbi:tail completion protein gp17 [Labrys sp. 22185]|uniref:tail completion protein gp17 n=1 Tax=Labrys sp. 22185 TaxID=3453888 RepID=UPI003F87B498
MVEAGLSLQKLIADRLLASADLLALVPADQIRASNARPEADRVVILGSGHTVYGDDYTQFYDRPALDIHVYTRESHPNIARQVAGIIREVLRARPWSADGWIVHGLSANNGRFFRDPGGEYAHAVISIDAVMQKAAA